MRLSNLYCLAESINPVSCLSVKVGYGYDNDQFLVDSVYNAVRESR